MYSDIMGYVLELLKIESVQKSALNSDILSRYVPIIRWMPNLDTCGEAFAKAFENDINQSSHG